jgi:hypothetical protein
MILPGIKVTAFSEIIYKIIFPFLFLDMDPFFTGKLYLYGPGRWYNTC